MIPVNDIDTYIANFDDETQRRLKVIRQTALSIFPHAKETIYHNLPTLWLNGKDILNYGAYKDHITLYIGYEATNIMRANHPQYQYKKASMMLSHSEPFPKELMIELCEIIGHILS